MLIKKSTVRLIFVFMFVFVSKVYPQSVLPHFFPEGVAQPSTPARQWQEWARYYNAARNALVGDQDVVWYPGFVQGSDTIILEKTYLGQRTKVVFDNYICEGKVTRTGCDGKIRYQSFDGQHYITEAQFRVVEKMFDDFAVRAVNDINYPFWGDLEKAAVAAAAKAENVTEEEFRKHLDKEDPHNPGITFRELRHIPEKIEKKDFIPYREIHLGLTPEYSSVLGVAWLNAGVVHYTPMAMMLDYILKSPEVLAHEFVHTNPKLQNMPLGWGLDLESMASIAEMLLDNDHLHLWRHGYAVDFREFAQVFCGFRFAQARDEITKRPAWMSMGNVIIDEEKLNEYSLKLNTCKGALRTGLKRGVEWLYSNPMYWSAMNDKTVDDNFVFRVVMSSMYNPTLLGGQDSTMRWLQAREYRIKEMMDKAWNESGSPREENNGNMQGSIFILKQIQGIYKISDEEVQKFLKANKISSPEEIVAWEPAKLRRAFEDFIRKERNQNIRRAQ